MSQAKTRFRSHAGTHECGFEPGKRTQARPKIGNARVMSSSIPTGISNQSNVARSRPDALCDIVYNVSKLPWKKGFIPAHARAISAHKHKAGGLHAQIVTFAAQFPGIMRSNNLWVSCRVSNGLVLRTTAEDSRRESNVSQEKRGFSRRARLT